MQNKNSQHVDESSKVAALLKLQANIQADQTADRAKLESIRDAKTVGAASSAKASKIAEMLGDKTAPTVVFDSNESQRLNKDIALRDSALAELNNRISQARLTAGYEAATSLKPAHAEHVAAVVKSLGAAHVTLSRYKSFKDECAANGVSVAAWAPLPDKLIDIIDAYFISAKDISR